MYNLINVWVTFATRINRYYILVITIPWGLEALLTSAPVTVLLAPNSHLHQKASNLAFNQAKSLFVCSNLVCPGVYTLSTVSFHLLPAYPYSLCLFLLPSYSSIFTVFLYFLPAHPYPLFPLPSCSSIFTLSFCTSYSSIIHIHFFHFLPTHPYSLFPLPSYSSIFTVILYFLPAHPDPLFPLPTHPYSLSFYFLPTHPLSSLRIPLQYLSSSTFPRIPNPKYLKAFLLPRDPPSSTAICCPHNYIT